jgi:chemotaxis protein MotA
MHVLIGLLGLVLVLAYAMTSQHSGAFTGLFHLPAFGLVLVGPLSLVVLAYPFEELRACLLATVRALRFSPRRSRAGLYEALTRFIGEVRARRPAQALAIAEEAPHALVRQLAPLVVRQYSAEDLERTSGTGTYCITSSLRRSEDILSALAKASPAMGLVGTVLGLIHLLKDLSRFDRMGPSMALALLCTLYGLVLANAVYTPMARAVRAYATASAEEARLLTRALVLVRDGKPLSDVRALFEVAAPGGAPAVGDDATQAAVESGR